MKEKEESFTIEECNSLIELVLKTTVTGLIIKDKDNNIRFVNKSWEEKHGDCRGKKCFEYLKGRIPKYDDCSGTKVIESGETFISEEYLPCDNRLYEVKRQLFEISPGKIMLAEVFVDITERKEVEERACTFSSIVEQSPSAIVITDTCGKIEYINPKFTCLTGYTMEEVKGKNPRILKSGESTSEEYKGLWNTIKTGKEWRGEFHNRKKNGELYWESASISPLRNLKGEITHFLAIKEDITERKKMEDELRRAKEQAEVANRVKGEFLANISHELRTPMNSILGFSKMLVTKSTENLTEKQIKGLHMINESGEKLLKLINHILELARLEGRKTELILEVFPLEDIILEVEAFTRNIIKDKITFSIHRGESLPVSIFSDRKKIVQILINLLSNAIKFTHKGEVNFTIYRDESGIVFSVKDTGVGIEQENITRIFDDFKKLGKGEAKNYADGGLGLATSKKLALMLNGQINVESTPGKGSNFSFTIPYFKI
ncbi:MAG TPA: PAS domain S-box protein [Candidatus Eremiobacteraeota bacterium]|nr:MAG: Non-motile and phage-resistance protein [bacterium ADurb.Bin363]HPZ09209.1 PAS domain S-box protein [Candidatus Eremiobacteraeota bacterium]